MAKAAEIPINTFYFDAKKRLLERYIAESGTVLDVGCGSGEYAHFLAENGFDVVGADLEKAKLKGGVEFVVLDLEKQKLNRKFDYVILMDVLEHIRDDVSALKNACAMLKNDGKLFLVVPAFPFLYGQHDKNCGHHRRYSHKELRRKLEDACFSIERITYWNFLGFFSALFSKMMGISQPYRQANKAPFVRKILLSLLRVEELVPLPFGLDLVVLASKS